MQNAKCKKRTTDVNSRKSLLYDACFAVSETGASSNSVNSSKPFNNGVLLSSSQSFKVLGPMLPVAVAANTVRIRQQSENVRDKESVEKTRTIIQSRSRIFELRSRLNNSSLHAHQRLLQALATDRTTMNTISDDENRLANPLVVQVVNRILDTSRGTVVIFWRNEDVTIEGSDCCGPGLGVLVLELTLGGNHGGKNLLIENGKVETCDIDD